jgi:hypothetical protein
MCFAKLIVVLSVFEIKVRPAIERDRFRFKVDTSNARTAEVKKLRLLERQLG